MSEVSKLEATRRRKSVAFTRNVLLGFGIGIAVGLFFGPYCAWLGLVGEAFVGLLQRYLYDFTFLSGELNTGEFENGVHHILQIIEIICRLKVKL